MRPPLPALLNSWALACTGRTKTGPYSSIGALSDRACSEVHAEVAAAMGAGDASEEEDDIMKEMMEEIRYGLYCADAGVEGLGFRYDLYCADACVPPECCGADRFAGITGSKGTYLGPMQHQCGSWAGLPAAFGRGVLANLCLTVWWLSS
jgi:hypothetical protein